MSECPACLRAQQVVAHVEYRRECPGCSIRQLAHMNHVEREKRLDLLTHLCGPEARRRVREEIRLELARIRKLRGERS